MRWFTPCWASRLLLAALAAAVAGCRVRNTSGSSAGQPEAAPPAAAPAVASPVPGEVTLIEIGLPEHAPTQAAEAGTAALAQRWSSKGLHVVGWVIGGPAQPPAANGYARIAVTAAELSKLGAVRALPSRVLVDRAGKVRHIYAGVDWPESANAEIEALLGEKIP